MSTLRLLVRCADGAWSGIVSRDVAVRAIAALGADPATFAELQQAIRRFIGFPPAAVPLAELLPGDRDTPHELGLVAIDLEARLMMADARGLPLTDKGGLFWLEADEAGSLSTTEVYLPFELADDWLLSDRPAGWRELAERRRELSSQQDIDYREVLYGQPLFEYIAARVWDEYQAAIASGLLARLFQSRLLPGFAPWSPRSGQAWPAAQSIGGVSGKAVPTTADPGDDDPPLERFDFRGSNAEWEIVKRLHVDWLLTPRGDLADRSPRQWALARHEHVMSDLDDQAQRWSLLQAEPPGVSPESVAFRRSSFGTNEWVEYYELVRTLLWDSWFRLIGAPSESALPDRARRSAQRLAGGCHQEEEHWLDGAGPGQRDVWRRSEPVRLAALAEAWLDEPDGELLGQTPRGVIERERSRLPIAVPAHHLPLEPDCPICEALARAGRISFWSLDGCNFDDDFAFDQYSETVEEWREKQVDWQQFVEQVSRED